MPIIPFDDRDGVIWLNGSLIPWREAKVHCLTHGLHYGSSVFEGERAYSGEIFKSREHTERLFRSAEILDMTVPFTVDQIEEAKYQVLHANGQTDAYVRPVVFRGSEMMAVAAQHSRIHVAIATWPWPTLFGDELVRTGVSLTLAPWRRPDPACAPVHAKAAGLYMIATLSKHHAEKHGFNDALMLDYRGLLAEATGANLFLVQDGALHTPVPDAFLDGITRRTVMDLARDSSISVIERPMEIDELERTQEVFLTGTAAEVTPVGRIDDRRYQVGQITLHLRQRYLDLVHRRHKAAA